MNNKTKRTIAATMVLPAALAVAGSAFVVGCPTDAGSGTETPTEPTFRVTITGTTKIGQKLTANVTPLNGFESAKIATATYVWKRDEVERGGNTNEYTLGEADIDQPITVTVSIVGAGVQTSSITPRYPNLNSGGVVIIENRSTSNDSNFTGQAWSGTSAIGRINARMTPFPNITKVIIGSTNKKVGAVLTIDATTILSAITAGGSANLNTVIINTLSAANSNDLTSAKSLDGVRLAGLQPKNAFDGLFRENKKITLRRGNRIAGSQSRQRLG